MASVGAAAALVNPERVLSSVGLVAYDWRLDTDTLTWGANAGEVLGIADAATIATGRGYAAYLDPRNATTRYDAVMVPGIRDDGAGVPYQAEYCLTTGPDCTTRLWIEDTGRWFAGANSRPVHAHGVVRVVNARHEQEERLAYLSQFDGLTGEMNRRALNENLTRALEDAIRYRASCGFLLIAIDNLARINEAFGFAIADEVIAAVGRRIRSRMRGADMLGRHSGNKFGVVLRNCTPDDMTAAAERFIAAVRDDVVQTAAGVVAATVTIGGVAAPRHAGTVEDMLARSQEALDAAKAKRRGSYLAYRPNVEREVMRKENVKAADELIAALNERRILLAFEPVVATATRAVAFHECLMRIGRADGTIAAAGAVIPVAERLGLVGLIDQRIAELVVAELAASPGLHASFNLSPASIANPEWWSAFEAQLRVHPGAAERVIVEITESMAIQDLGETIGFLNRLRDLGCRIAIDDFGAGFTSLRNLRKLGADMLKIDGAFVQNLARSDDDRAFVRTMIDLARSLKLATVAEWVQDEESVAMLAAWGCDYLQGHLVGRATLRRPWAPVAPAPEAARQP